MRLIQYRDRSGHRRVARSDVATIAALVGHDDTLSLARTAILAGRTIESLVAEAATGATDDLDAIIHERRILPPLDHPDPAHLIIAGTGLTHLGSADSRNAMHADTAPDKITDSMKMFRDGVAGGKPADGAIGAQPEWFYKGDGSILAAPESPLVMPAFALDGGEEPEIAGLYLIGPDGTPYRVGFALGNEFSDHVTERQNYLLLAHSKLRACSYGPELLLGDLPADLRGTSLIRRDGKPLWSGDFVTGEANMSHWVRNLEHHHFKYRGFRRPGDVHCHFFGTATLSFAAGVRAEPGDVFEISMAEFGRPLRNALARDQSEVVAVRAL